MTLRVKDWARFQHYKHRRPPWIRLHRQLLDDMTWHRLPLASRALAPMLWLLASETQDGRIEGDSEVLAFRLRLASTDFEEALNPLISAGWFVIIEPASTMLAPRKQPATSEFRVQSTDYLNQSLTDAARDPALNGGSGPRASRTETSNERLIRLATEHRQATLRKGQA